jgi:hypothetical protein
MDRVALHLVIQDDPKDDRFPINVLRNVAVNNSLTDMIFTLDVDFIVSPNMFGKLQTMHRYESMWNESYSKHVFIVPAFEFNEPYDCLHMPQLERVGATEGDGCFAFPLNREGLLEMMDKGLFSPFHPQKKGHRATNILRWKHERRLYYVHWENWYEPYIVARKSQLDFPWFDERFYDRGHNKVVFAFELYVRGYQFTVLTDFFCVHRWEPETEALQLQRPQMPGHGSLYASIEESLRERFKCPASRDFCPTPETQRSKYYSKFIPVDNYRPSRKNK